MTTKHSTIYELTHPFSRVVVNFFNDCRNVIDQYQVNRMKKQVLARKFDNLTDPTFLDRALKGEA